ncbi:MAG: hypothetical protein ACRENU_05185 [Gemmatimonadaceae bacterium]
MSAPLPAQSRAAREDSALAKRARGAAHGVMKEWRKEWMRGYRDKSGNSRRDAAGHCHYDGSGYNIPPNIVHSTTRKSMCPTWYPIPNLARDERLGIDAALREDGRNKIRARRATVLAILDTALSAMPDNAELHAQRVRFAVDQRDSTRVRLALEQCRGSDGWCGMLAVFAAAKSGRLGVADSLLDLALKEVVADTLCPWTDVVALLEPSERKAYEGHSCKERLRLEPVFWWLADPFWSVPRNERRAEHFARVVEIILRAQLETDERFDWRKDKGGTAVSQMVLRYGWPSFIGWLGHHEDNGHRSWLGFDDGAVATPAPEYTAPRAHVVPPWRVVANPAALARDDWRDMTPRRSRNRWDVHWWAQEHMRLGAGPMVSVPDQTAFFRRARNALAAVATQMTDGSTPTGVAYTASLVVGVEPDLSATVDRPARAGERIAMLAPLNEPSVLSVEVLPQHDSTAAMGRSRYGVVPPSALAELPRGEIGLSDLALFETQANAPATLNELLNVMLPSTTVPRGARLGVFWEAYGVRPGDTVDVKIRVQREDRGILRGIAALAGLASDEKDAVEISWREPQPGLVGRAFDEAGTPVQSRAITLGLAALDPGKYSVALTVTPLRAPAAVSTRALEIR